MRIVNSLIRASTLAVLAASTAVPALARDLFVNNVTGDDHNDALAATTQFGRNGPARTIAKALRAAQSGDRIVLAKTNQPYRECVTLQGGRHSGLLGQPFVIEGNGATLDGRRPVPAEQWQRAGNGLFVFQPPRLGYQQLFQHDDLVPRRAAGPARDAMPDLQPHEWCVHGGMILFRPKPEQSLSASGLNYAAERVGITMYEVRNVVIRDLVVQGYQLDGINAHDGARQCQLVGITSRANGRSGVSIGGASRVNLAQCRCEANGVVQFRTEGHCRVAADECEFAGDHAAAWHVQGGHVTINGQPATGVAPAGK